MNQKTRLIILFSCAVLFLVITPYIVLYSLGYRVDFAHLKVVATGGIYVRALPEPLDVSIDNNLKNTTGILSNSVFFQNLLPGFHQVSITKEGYYSYQKKLLVVGNQVAKLEHVTLFPKQTPFKLLAKNIQNSYLAPDGNTMLLTTPNGDDISFEVMRLQDNQQHVLGLSLLGQTITSAQWSQDSSRVLINVANSYYLFQPFLTYPKLAFLSFLAGAKEPSFNPDAPSQFFFIKNNNLYTSSKTLPLIKGVEAYQITNGAITYLASDGFLYTTDTLGGPITKASAEALAINPSSSYQLTDISGTLFLIQDQSLMLFNQTTKVFGLFDTSVNSIALSPDGQKILYVGDHQISYSPMSDIANIKTILNSLQQISNVNWLNSDYLVFQLGNQIIISEIDTRGNVNTVTLPTIINQSTSPNNTFIVFNQTDKKLYVLTAKTLVSFAGLLPQ